MQDRPGEPAPVVRRVRRGSEESPGPREPPQPPNRPRRRSRLLLLAAALVLTGASAMLLGWRLGAPPETAAPEAPASGSPPPVTPLLSARRVPAFTTAMVPRRAMTAAVQPIADAAPPHSCISVGDGAEDLYAHKATEPLVPASNQKLVTAAAALAELGADSTLTTRFLTAAPPKAGVVRGDLYMVGGGDPLLTTEGYQVHQQHGRFPGTDLEAVADDLVAAGLRKVTGSVVGDASRYDAQRSMPGWPRRWQAGGTVAPLSALLVNDGWLVDPVTGSGPGGPAPDPAQHAAAVMTRLLTDRGVEIVGPPVSGTGPAGTHELLAVDSLPMSGIVGEMLTFSDNTTAELLLKEIGVHSSGTGSTAAGIDAVTEWAKKAGLAAPGWVMADGSGLSSDNRLTCAMLADVLRSGGPRGVIAEGLAVPQAPGTLDDRFAKGDMETRLRAKTGTLNDVTALSGWFHTAKDAELDFEFIINTADRGVTSKDLGLQVALLDALVDQPIAPPLAEAGPLRRSDG